MAVREILQVGADVLREKSEPVKDFDINLLNLLQDMKDTLADSNGVGLAAPQIGVSKRIFVIDVEEGYYEFINPRILGTSGSQYGQEGCLSVKGMWGDVKRPNKVTVEAQDRYGKKFKVVARELFARCVCHENDHLDGILYIDKANNLREDDKKKM